MKMLRYILGIPNTLRMNIKCFGLREGMKLPILCSHSVRIKSLYRGSIVIDGSPKTGMIRFGLGEGSFGSGGVPQYYQHC